MIEASKQCGRNRLMEIAGSQPWASLVASTAEVPHRWMAHPYRGDAIPSSSSLPPPIGPSDRVVLAVGPEGGFAPEEVAMAAQSGWHLVGLGPRTLRVETAAIYLAAMVAVRTPS